MLSICWNLQVDCCTHVHTQHTHTHTTHAHTHTHTHTHAHTHTHTHTRIEENKAREREEMLRRQEELAKNIPAAPMIRGLTVPVQLDEDYFEDYESIVIDTGMATVKVKPIPRFAFPGLHSQVCIPRFHAGLFDGGGNRLSTSQTTRTSYCPEVGTGMQRQTK